MTYPVCPCDDPPLAAPVNLPELSYISYRAGDWVDFRQWTLTPLYQPATPEPLPLEQTLSVDGAPVWRTDGVGDLAVMIAEWFAYVADVITFYNERIANQDYLRTADLAESVNNLIALLGYRPRPAIGAYGALAALLSPGPSFGGRPISLPAGLQFQSKPTPGLAPQTFELTADTLIFAPDTLSAIPPPMLLAPVQTSIWHYSAYHAYAYSKGKYAYHPIFTTQAGESNLLLQGAVKTIDAGALLRLRARDPANGGPWLATVVSAAIGPSPSGSGQQTSVNVTLSAAPPAGLTAAEASLESPGQNTAVWTIFGGAISGTTVHLASLVRQIRPGDWLLFTAASGFPGPVLAQVASTTDMIWDANAGSQRPTTTTTSKSRVSTRHQQPGAHSPHPAHPRGAQRLGRRRRRDGEFRLVPRGGPDRSALQRLDRVPVHPDRKQRPALPLLVQPVAAPAGFHRPRNRGGRRLVGRQLQPLPGRPARSGPRPAAALPGAAQSAGGHPRQDRGQ